MDETTRENEGGECNVLSGSSSLMNARRDGQQLNESDAMGGSGSHRRRVVLFKFGAPFVRK